METIYFRNIAEAHSQCFFDFDMVEKRLYVFKRAEIGRELMIDNVPYIVVEGNLHIAKDYYEANIKPLFE